MKSPLVEALRQAGSGNDESEQPSPDEREIAVDESQDTAVAAPEPDELQLMEATGVLPIDGSGILPIDGDGIPPTVGDLGSPGDTGTEVGGAEVDAEFFETASLAIGNDETLPATDDQSGSYLPPVLHTRSRSGLSRLGLYSPLFCAILAAAATGSYFVYQGLSGWYQNKDLENLSSQVGMPVGQEQVESLESAVVPNPFELVVGSRQTARSDQPASGAGEVVPDAVGTGPQAGRGEPPQAAAEREIKHRIQQQPGSAHLQFALGSLFAGQARWAEARSAFDAALRLDAGNADYLFNLAVSLEHLGQYADARQYYEAALDAANATSTLDSAVAVARIAELASLSRPENSIQ